jgi:prolyl 3-hydroxylase /prolyl 3,4-dihydroxylase
MEDSLLRKVRSEIRENVHFTPKETDIYKIHQSGDLANLDGLEDEALSKLPSLLKLRDALYSPAFRKYVATITNSGELSGRKTDMAINVYTPGCHLLCHDDVIGSRKVSYILYLTDPDMPWQEDWGGALRLYPTSTFKSKEGDITKTPSPDFSKAIPPAWNQLSFFAVQPGESFHDVEEVYHAANKEQQEKEGGRIRMAISGWYHIPQIGEEGYVAGEEERSAAKSSLDQLQGKADRFDFPQEQLIQVESIGQKGKISGLEASHIDFLLKYMAPTYLVPDTIDQIAEHFTDQSSVTLDGLLSKKFAASIREYLEKQEASPLPATAAEIEKGPWNVAKPPHKHRFLYLQRPPPTNDSSNEPSASESPIQELLDVFLPSPEFQWWLELTTCTIIENYSVLGRRFRRGKDYALATSHDGNPRLEICLGLTPTTGWGGDDDAEEDDTDDADDADDGSAGTNGAAKPSSKSKAKEKAKAPATEEEDDDDVGGHEVYMASDDADGQADAAVYKSTNPETDDDNVLFTSPPSWNKLSIVLRDSGVLTFVKYVSRKAPGDRWDVVGCFGVEETDEGGEEEELEREKRVGGERGWEKEVNGQVQVGSSFETNLSNAESQVTVDELVSSGEEGEDGFNGFPDSDDSDSD